MENLPDDIHDMIDDFAFLDDWEDRYMHVIEMGKALPPLSGAERCPTNKVSGCVSQVWLVSTAHSNGETRLNYRGDSDAHIVKGLVAVVLKIFSGRTKAEVERLNVHEILDSLGLSEHLSAQRANGLQSMISRIEADFAAL